MKELISRLGREEEKKYQENLTIFYLRDIIIWKILEKY